MIHAYRAETFPQSLLIEGIGGIGKKYFALELSKLLICEQVTQDEACGLCPSCLSWNPQEGSPYMTWLTPCKVVKSGSDSALATRFGKAMSEKREAILDNPYDLHVFQSDDQVYMEQIRKLHVDSSFARSQNHIVFLPEADRFTKSSANALLKILEEAPPSLYFILTTSNRSGLLPTILSRCSRIHLPPNSMDEILNEIKTDVDISIDPQVLVHLADFSIGKAQDLMQGDPASARRQALEFLEHVVREKPGRYTQWCKSGGHWAGNKEASLELLKSIELLWSDFLASKLSKPLRNQDIEMELQSHPMMQQSVEFFFQSFELFQLTRYKILGNSNLNMAMISLGLQLKERLN